MRIVTASSRCPVTMLLLLTSCRRKAAKIGAVLTPAEAVAISWHETACERYAWTRSERITHSAEAWLWTMNGSYPPFEDYARAVAIRYTGALCRHRLSGHEIA